MKPILRAERMKPVHSDIRGPLYVEAMKRQKQGIDILKLNTGNPATFGFGLPDSIRNALMEHMQDGVGYCDFKGMSQARQAICDYETSKGIKGITPDDVFIGNGVSEVVSFALTPLLNDGDEVLVPSPSYSLWGNSVYLEDGKPVFTPVMRKQAGIRTFRISVLKLQIKQKLSLSSIRITQLVYSIQKKSFLRSSRLQENLVFSSSRMKFMTVSLWMVSSTSLLLR